MKSKIGLLSLIKASVIFCWDVPVFISSYFFKVDVSVKDSTIIKPIAAKKTYNVIGLKSLMEEKTKEWFTYGEDKEENKRQKNMFLWNAFL